MKSKLSNARLSEKVAAVLQRVTRMEAALMTDDGIIQCVTCGKREHWTKMQGGHFISRRHAATRCDQTNIHPQCARCNGPESRRSSIVAIRFTLYMDEIYGREYVTSMLCTAQRPGYRYNRSALLAMLENSNSRQEHLEKLIDEMRL